MTSGMCMLLEGTLTFGVPLGFAIRELMTLKRHPSGPDDPGDDGLRRGDPPPRPLPDSEPRRPALPACLIPNPTTLAAARTPSSERFLEPV
jgi:hypothetical protein